MKLSDDDKDAIVRLSKDSEKLRMICNLSQYKDELPLLKAIYDGKADRTEKEQFINFYIQNELHYPSSAYRGTNLIVQEFDAIEDAIKLLKTYNMINNSFSISTNDDLENNLRKAIILLKFFRTIATNEEASKFYSINIKDPFIPRLRCQLEYDPKNYSFTFTNNVTLSGAYNISHFHLDVNIVKKLVDITYKIEKNILNSLPIERAKRIIERERFLAMRRVYSYYPEECFYDYQEYNNYHFRLRHYPGFHDEVRPWSTPIL